MKATELARKCENVSIKYNTVYMWGCFGQPVTDAIIEQKAKQYPSFYTAAKKAELKKLVGKNYFGFDCVNLLKGILWGWNGNKNKSHGGAVYASNGVPDVNADTFFQKCTDKSSDFSKIEVGEAVWMKGHIGIYIGDNLVVECTPIWKDGVQVTAITTKAGYNTRKWTQHGKIPYVEYAPAYPCWKAYGKYWYYYTSENDYVKAPSGCWKAINDGGKKYFVESSGRLITNITINSSGEVK